MSPVEIHQRFERIRQQTLRKLEEEERTLLERLAQTVVKRDVSRLWRRRATAA